MLRFTVYGVAQQKGSVRAFMRPGMQFPIVTDSNRSAKSWQQLVAQGANEALGLLPASERAVLTGPVRISVAFFLPRPKKYSKRGVYVEHLTKPDVDKLLRAILDALKGTVWQDDRQVVVVEAVKRYAPVDHVPHVDIWVSACSTQEFAPTFEAAGPVRTDASLLDLLGVGDPR